MPTAASAAPTPARRRAITAAVTLATVIQTLDTTIANVALPRMQGEMGATQEQIAWVLTSYIVATAICMPLTGFLAERFGRRRLFIASVVGFTLASMLCGVAATLGQIVLFRVLQGAFGAFLVPLAQAVLLDTWPREKQTAAMAVWGVGVMLGPILGPTLGGWLTEYQSWRWVFFINLPIGIVTTLGLLAWLPETPTDRGRRFDLAGFAYLAIGLAALQLMLDRGESLGWFESREIVLEAALAALGLYLFVVHILTHTAPFVQPRLFTDRNFAAGLATAFAIGLVLLATTTLLPPFLQGLMGYPVFDTGLLLAPRGAGTALAMIAVGRLGDRADPRLLILLGLGLCAASLHAMTAFDTDVTPRMIAWTGIVQGLGIGFVFPPLTTITFASLAPRDRNEGTALFSLVRNIGSSVGISVVVSALSHNIRANHAALAEHIDASSLPLRLAIESGAWRLDTPEGLAALDAEVTRQATTIAFLQDFRLMMWVCLAAMPLVLLLRRPVSSPAPGHVAALD
ncbi:MAG: DHA2 family efflux MFS transporter permease subunit [Burkholderiales bacterium]|nr:MAG: DHA2 family efflux MFS transporter permease subunit [Burkholderiales bacterium]